MALASCHTNARLDVKRDLGVRNFQSIVDLCKSMRLDISSGFFSLTSRITVFSIVESSPLPCGRGTLNNFLDPFAVENVGDSVRVFGPDTPPFSDLKGCLKKFKRSTLLRNLLRESNTLRICKPLNTRPTPLQMPNGWQFCSNYSRCFFYGISWQQHPPQALRFSQGRGERLVMSRNGPWEGYRRQAKRRLAQCLLPTFFWARKRDVRVLGSLCNAFRDGIILIVINLEPKLVDTKNTSQ